jgi:hypothetical protein
MLVRSLESHTRTPLSLAFSSAMEIIIELLPSRAPPEPLIEHLSPFNYLSHPEFLIGRLLYLACTDCSGLLVHAYTARVS